MARSLEITEARRTSVGQLTVHRALPTRGRRTVGAWCFVDHMGPATFSPGNLYDVAPHPHIGLQTVTWLFDGGFVHRDSLGSEQLIRPGQLNLMTAGHGVAHSEENPGLTRGELHGVQLWVAQPSATRDGESAFEHRAEVPRVERAGLEASVLVGEFLGATSSARHDTDLVGVELRLGAGAHDLELEPDFEYAIVVAMGAVAVDGAVVAPERLAFLGRGRAAVRLVVHGPSTAMLLGGRPLGEDLFMWWNFVARTPEEIVAAWESWTKADGRFGTVDSELAPLLVGAPPWTARRA